ncbi:MULTISPECIES: hypothetical protein [Paenibacillus]|uniref:Uncharacterized protein n=1 Tax=Paenibacillus polymyxa (strain SC2) TaxID=886882 RepID=E3EGR9_PAEPS|nr:MULTISPECIES: hypothetical protein [Paenibacillus]ADO55153.1 hypothetical protein PPSC2_05690 [Paenibacillus polymyxa SC2]AZH28365.1 hypothetical protein EGM68_06095 [Paenibacillus sp. M-152]OAZ49308.1 hypothetical protein A9Z39_11590 [Paenibacillus polymyxa]WPQ57972.1 hypothetical protein SKN87_05815 [Paenibacillus polymyxa]CCC84005.1 hypothetical protein PPM_1068 [Paenibacillus polymyxa M1]
MASEKTPNLGLNQIDRTSPKTTYFDLEKYLDQNWRSVDEFAGEVNDGVNEIKKRLDTTERKAVTLEPGVQIVHAEKAAPFSLTGLSGRTLVNLLGRWGNLSSLMGVTPYQADIALDNLNKGTMPNSLKVTIKPGYTVGVGFYSNFKFLSGKYYVAIVRAKVGNATDAGISAPNALVESKVIVKDKTKFATAWFRLAPTSDIITNIDLVTQGTVGQYSYFEAARIYEISAAEYTALATMTDEQIDTKYPYVDSVMPVRNPYAIRYGENLIPPFYEWTLGERAKVINPYKLETVATVSVDQSNVYVPVVPGTTYTLTVKVNGRVTVVETDDTGLETTVYSTTDNENRIVTVTFTTKTTTKRVRIYATNTGAGTYTLENPMLNIGSMAKPFKPCEHSMLALQTDLYADPVTGGNADTVFEQDGQYFKAKKWKGITLDGSRAWVLGDAAATAGVRQVKVVALAAGAVAASGTGTKFDGKVLPQGSTGNTADTNAVTAAGDIYIGVSMADSGWADSYSPAQDDIKAYFYGWKVYDAGTFTPTQAQAATTATWNGTGAKYYVPRVGSANPVASVPVTSYAGYTPYQLVYQLATPTVEPVASEGQLSFVEGDNQVEVGTGIVLREVVKLDDRDPVSVYINSINSGTRFQYPSGKILSIYKNGAEDFSWYKGTYVYSGEFYAYGQIARSNFDQTSTYSATYLMLDKPPVVSFIGSYAANEKTLLLDLIDNIRQNTARVSVLESKKADKDSPAWITPTLLSGATPETDANKPQYTKMSDGMVLFRGAIKVPISGDVLLFNLPPEFRPSAPYTVISCWVSSSTHGQEAEGIVIRSDGSVRGNLKYVYDNWIRLDSIRFPTN